MTKIELFVYGKNGKHGAHGSDGRWYGGNGEHGEHGEHGESLKPLNIQLSFDSEKKQTIIKYNNNFFRAIPSHNLYQSTFSIKAIGGNGGNGGNGGRGGNGRDGENGRDATQYSCGTNGESGTNGGGGGNGGNGGNAGNGGDVNIYVNQEDMDLLMLIDQVSTSPGVRGEGGLGGRGGYGGRGGRGGAEYRWTETIQTTVHDDNYISGYRTDTTYRYHSNPGGINGANGSSGSSGHNGSYGMNGLRGKYCIFLNKTNLFYSDRYNLIITHFKPLISDDGIIEPGEAIALNHLTVLNNGFMPTPKVQLIEVSLKSTNWIQPGESIKLPGWLSVNQKYTSDQTLNFTVKSNLSFVPNQVPKAQVTLGWNALVPRVNKYFDSISCQKTTFEVRYPVEISLICGAHAITRVEEAPFVVQVRNVSTLPIGGSAGIPRKLQLEISSSSGKELNWFPKDNNTSIQRLEQPIIFDIPLLAANSSYFVAGTLKFINANLPFYTKIPLQANLKLGQRNSSLLPKLIQKSESTLQLGENYIYDPNARFVLIINSSTTKDEIEAWKEITLLLGSSLTVWNVSLYSGVDFNYKRKDGGKFIEQLIGKTVIILNNKYTDDFTNKEKNIVSEDLCLAEIYYAAKKAMISTYIVGSTIHLYNQDVLQYIPNIYTQQNESEIEGTDQFSMGEIVTDETVIKKYAHCSSLPYAKDLKKIAEKLQTELHEKKPEGSQIVVYYHKSKYLEEHSTCLSTQHELGKIFTWNGISNLQAKIAFCMNLPSSNWQPSTKNQHIFVLLKLLSFEKKLNFLITNYHFPNKYPLIVDAIISDLADEQYVWRQHKWSGYFPKEKLKGSLITLKSLVSFNFKDMPAERLMIILMKYYALISLLPSFWDYCWFYRRGRILTTVCKEIVKNMIIKLYPVKNIYQQLFVRLTEEAKEFKEKFKNNNRSDVLAYIRNPYDNIKFNNSKPLTNALNYAAMPVAKVPNRNIVEERYLFFGAAANINRKEAINKFESLAKSDYSKPKLHLPKPDHHFDSPDNLNSVLKFVGPSLRNC